MNKTELVAAMAKETHLSKKDVEAVLKSFIDVVSDELKKGEKVQLVGFGTFEVSERAAREGRNPQTGATMKIEASKAWESQGPTAQADSRGIPAEICYRQQRSIWKVLCKPVI